MRVPRLRSSRQPGWGSTDLTWDPVEAAGLALVIESVAGEVATALRRAGVESILLKGPVLDRWLYEAGAPRMYTDIDLLVDPRQTVAAGRVLSELGFSLPAPELRISSTDHADGWSRADGMEVDLHHALVGVPSGLATWGILRGETETMELAGAEVLVLAPAARALHVALHAAAHGIDADKTQIDLARALERLEDATWRAAAELAERLDATEGFAAGLRLLPEGAALARRLDLPETRSVETAMFASSVPYESWFFNRLAGTPGLGGKLRLVAQRLAPEPEFMRAWYPIARRGRAGLAMAYVWRQLWLAAHAGPAVLGWVRARREARTR